MNNNIKKEIRKETAMLRRVLLVTIIVYGIVITMAFVCIEQLKNAIN